MTGTAAPERTEHVSTATGIRWEAVETVYYDCHVVSLAQLLPSRLFAAFLLCAGVPTLRADWGGLRCGNLLDSEPARDVLLLNEFGVEKHRLPVEGDVEATVRGTVRRYGHCIARVDSYYHEHFAEYYLTEHRTNGHKVTVIDFDQHSYTGIDNVGIRTLVLRFDRTLFLESIRANLFHVYDKYDSLYRLHVGPEARARYADGTILDTERRALEGFLRERATLGRHLASYRQFFVTDLAGSGVRRYAQLVNSYQTALMIERAYLAITEAHARSVECWDALPDRGERFIVALRRAIRAWRLFKMLCRAAHTTDTVSPQSLVSALDRVLDAERDTASAAAPANPRLGT